MSERHQVIVVGGGVAGLSVAAELLAAGIDVRVLEARDRLGGRVLTVDDGAEPLELGAEFVHGDAPRTTAIAASVGLELLESKSTMRASRGGKLVDTRELREATQQATGAAIRAAEEAPEDRSFADALDASGAAEPGRTLAVEYVQSFEAADALRLSSRAFAMGDLGVDRSRRVPSGYGRLVEALAQRIPARAIALSTVVSSVRWSRGRVTLSTAPDLDASAEDTHACERLVLTLPLAPLAEVRFVPGLEAKARPLRLLTTGVAARIALRFREAFWRDRLATPMTLRCPGSPFPVFWSGPRASSTVLNGWVGGPAAMRLRGLDTERMADRAMDTLSHALGMRPSAVESSLRDAHFHDWTADPFAQGAYSYSLVGGAGAPRALAQPLDETLFFAGEASCDPPENGTVEGAIETGVRAAREVLASLRG